MFCLEKPRWKSDDLMAMLGRPAARALEVGTKILLGTPKDQPKELIERIGKIVQSDIRTESVWLAMARWPDRMREGWLLDVRTSVPNAEITPFLRGICDGGAWGSWDWT
jgi:hypothetical protein